jgi:hypothetical protein
MGNAIPAQSGLVAAQEPSKTATAPAKSKRNRRFSKEIISESEQETVLSVKHTPHKGEKISNTIRKDHKFNPNQRFTAGRREL